MSEARDRPAGGILMPREIRGGQADPAKVRALRENMQPAVSTVVGQVPRYATFSRSFLPSDMETVSDQLAGQSGQLVAIYSLLVKLERPVMVIPFEWDLPPEWVFEQVAEAWQAADDQQAAIYTEDPTGQVPFPVVMGTALIQRVQTQIRRDPPEVEHYLRQIPSRKITPSPNDENP